MREERRIRERLGGGERGWEEEEDGRRMGGGWEEGESPRAPLAIEDDDHRGKQKQNRN